jgi:hypothetical protein
MNSERNLVKEELIISYGSLGSELDLIRSHGTMDSERDLVKEDFNW